jgi:hypothetical protein
LIHIINFHQKNQKEHFDTSGAFSHKLVSLKKAQNFFAALREER